MLCYGIGPDVTQLVNSNYFTTIESVTQISRFPEYFNMIIL